MGTTIPAISVVVAVAVAVHAPGTPVPMDGAHAPGPALETQVPASASPAGHADASAAVDAPAAQDPSTLLRRTSAAYEAMTALRADFRQELQNTMLGRTTRSAGTLYQREPDRFLMDFSDPEGDLIVSDGRHFWMYFPSVDAKQVVRVPRRSQGLDLQAQFIGDVVERFDATYHGTEEVRGRTTHVMTLDPREPLGYRLLKVWIDDQDHLVRRFELTEENGNVRHMELSDVTVNPTLPDSLFEFTPPADAIIVSRG